MSTIATKMTLGFGAVASLMVGGIGAGVWATHSSTRGFSELLADENQIALLALGSTSELLQERRSEKDFLMRNEIEYAQKVREAGGRLDANIAAMMVVAHEHGHEPMAAIITQLSELAHTYAATFDQLVSECQQRGLTPEQGIRGKFRQTANRLDERVQENAVGELGLTNLQLRDAQASYERTESPVNLERWNAVLTRFAALVDIYGKTSRRTQETATVLRDQLTAYRQQRDACIAVHQQGADREALWEGLRSGPMQRLTTILASIYIPDLEILFQQMSRTVSDYALDTSAKNAREARSAQEAITDAINGSAIPDADKRSFIECLGDYRSLFDELVAIDTSITGRIEKMRDAAHAMEPIMDKLHETADQALASGAAAVEQRATSIARIDLLMGGLVLALGIGVAVLMTRMVVRPTRAMAAAIDRVARGDLTVSIQAEGTDELAGMGRSLNRMVTDLHQVIREIRESASATAASSEELSASAQTISRGAQQQAGNVEEISSSIGSLVDSVRTVAQASEAADGMAGKTIQLAGIGTTTVGHSIAGMKQIHDSSKHIKKIINVIGEIASQTNLLALNAAIEAASAGEHGLGFAVVADEVRKLAERSSQAAGEITQLIEEEAQRVDEGQRLSGDVSKALTEMVTAVESTAGKLRGITQSAVEQSRMAEQVSTAMEGVAAITEENSGSAEEMAASAEELSGQAQRLQMLVERFTTSEDDDASIARPRAAVAAPARTAPGLRAASQAPRPPRAAVGSDDVDQGGAATPTGALYHA